MEINPNQLEWFRAKGPVAARLRRRKFALVRKFGFPENLLPGSLCQSFRTCGRPGCHCVDDEGHPMWSLNLSLDGVKHIEPIPMGWATELQAVLAASRRYRDALREVLTINAELLRLYRREQRTRRSSKRRRTSGDEMSGKKRKKRSTRRR